MSHYVLPASVQKEISNKIIVKPAALKEIFQDYMNKVAGVDSKMLRHVGTNYESLYRTNWYSNLRETYGEYVYTYLREEVSNRLSIALLVIAEQDKFVTKAEYEKTINRINADCAMLSSAVSALLEKVEIAQAKFQETMNQLDETTVKLDETTVKLDATIVELKTTRVQLEDTRIQLDKTIVRAEKAEARLDVLEVEIAKLNHFDFKAAIKNWEEAKELMANGTRHVQLEVSTVAEAVTESVIEARVKVEMLDRLINAKSLTESLADFSLRVEQTYNQDVSYYMQILDALLGQAAMLESRLKDIKKKIILKV